VTEDVIVAATVFHADVVAALHAACFPAESWDRNAIARLLGDSAVDGLLLCAAEDDPVGFALVRTAADEAEILTIGIRPDARGRGLGHRMVAAACETAARRGALRLFLEVSECNVPALSMYRRAGFESVGRRRHYYGVGIDALVLRIAVAPDAGA
jgi:ribosomal-protein-alanine N-acetyltransferase